MLRFHLRDQRLLLAVFVCLLGVLAGCSSSNVHLDKTAIEQGHYDMVISAYKDGQFQLDGGVLAAPDLEGHFAYLQSSNQLPQTVLLKDGKDTGVNSPQLRELARLQGMYGFTAYIEHDGELKSLIPEKKD